MPVKIVYNIATLEAVNVIELEDDADWSPGEGFEVAYAPVGINIGDAYDPRDGSFTPYAAQPPTDDELRQKALEAKLARKEDLTPAELSELLRLERGL